MTNFIEERMTGHVKDVHFDFSITDLHSANTHAHTHKVLSTENGGILITRIQHKNNGVCV